MDVSVVCVVQKRTILSFSVQTQENQDKEVQRTKKKKIPAGTWTIVLCVVQYRQKGKIQDKQDKKKIPIVARFSATVQTGPGAHPASYNMGTGFLCGDKEAGTWR
jgi:GTP-sensing pleiotropic transcriptional regulator CodY